MTTDIIEVNNISKRFGKISAVNSVNISFHAGEMFGLIGHNGAGKSTLFKMMLGLLQPTAGTIHIKGMPVSGEKFRQVRRHIGYLPENIVFYDNLSGLETMRFIADLKKVKRKECIELLKKMGLGKAAHRAVRTYSKGMRQRLGFAQALLGKPDLLFLDEPTTGLDPSAIREFYQTLQELKEQGVTIILSSHNLAEIEGRVDRLALMQLAEIRAIGTVNSLRDELLLPMHFIVGLTDRGEELVRNVVDNFIGASFELYGTSASVFCKRQDKLPMLSALTAIGDSLKDIQMKEPSLEDVYLGYVES